MAQVQLECLKLTGFKSFPDSAELSFGGRVSAIIGPNGCGKSNVVDAMLWVLGEQSPSLLRLKAMGDVVFSGASGRAPAGAAEVVLELSSDDGRWEATGGRLEIRRRVFRTGPSEYRINGKVARLRDVADALMSVGLGTRNYAIIEQGRVGQVLSARPTDRRALIEEAAGITHYKARRHEAELKLEHTRQNLLRIEDVISEVDRTLRQLRRQANQADRHQKLETQLKDRLLRLFTLQAHALDGVRQELARRRATVQNEVAAAASALGGADADLEQARSQLESSRHEVEGARVEVAELLGSRERLEAFLERSADLLDTLRASLDRTTRDQVTVESNRSAVDQAVAAAGSRLEELARAASSVREKVDEAATAEIEARQRLEAMEARAGQTRQDLLKTISTLTDSRNRLGALDREQDRLAYAISQLEQELERAEERRNELNGRYEAASNESRLAADAAEALAGERQEKTTTRSDLRQQTMEARHEAEALGHAAWELRHRLAGVDRELARHTQALDQVGALLPDEAVLGQLSDFLHPQPERAADLDRVWRDELELPVISQSTLSPEQRRLASKLEGRIRLAVAADAEPAEDAPSLPGCVPLLEAAGITDEHLPWLARILKPAYLCDNADQARRLADEHPDVLILDPDGVLWRGRAMEPRTAGTALRGTLALKVEKDELQASLDRTVEKTEATSSRHKELAGRLDEVDRQLAAIETRTVQAEQERARTGAVEQSLSEEMGRLQRETDSIRTEIGRNVDLAGELKRRREKLASDVTSLDARSLELEQAVEEASNSLDSRREESAEALRQLDRWQADAQLAGERESAASTEVKRLEEERRQLGERLSRLQSQAKELADELERTETEVVRSRTRLTEELGLMSAAREQERVLSERREKLSAQVDRLEVEVKSLRQRHQETRDALHEAEVERTRSEGQWDSLRENALSDLALSPEQLLATEVVEGDEEETLRDEIDRLRARLEKMGPVNLLALREVGELEERSTFLKTQRKDLVDALKSLDATIHEIDTTCTDRFIATYEQVNVVFAETFIHLFGGGDARLDLVDEDDPLYSGIDIIAQPPGKKTQSVQLLSGGEKALTALSLLIALFRIKPSPFCILDEVDAPLDDANVERLAELVKSMTDHTQFIMVTHNRRTMARADVLYGITMEEAGVSKVVSVRLEE